MIVSNIPDGEPFEGADFFVFSQSQSDILVDVTFQSICATLFIRNDEADIRWPDGCADPEKCILSQPIVEEILNENGVIVDHIDITGHLMSVGVEFTQRCTEG